MIGQSVGALVLTVACAWAAGGDAGLDRSLALQSRAIRVAERDVPSPLVPGEPGYRADHARVRAAVQEVLARREFGDLYSDPNAFMRWVAEWVYSVVGRIVSALRDLPDWAVWVIVGWMILTLGAILGHLIYTLWTILGGTARGLRAGPSGRGHRGELLGIRDLDFDSVYAEAGRLLAAGDWIAATRYLYVAAILWLDRQGWIAFRPAKTNREYLGELRMQGQLQGTFRRLTDGFEAIVYGGRPATMTTSHEMASTVEGLLHEPARTVAN
jgi:hypothetical protein